MPDLRTTLDQLTKDFATSLALALRSAVKGASVHDILAREARGTRTVAARALKPVAKKAPKAKGGRLMRRTPADINRGLASVVGVLNKGPLHAEAIRMGTKLDVRELPRVLSQGLKTNVLTKSGEKRATKYRIKTVSIGSLKKKA